MKPIYIAMATALIATSPSIAQKPGAPASKALPGWFLQLPAPRAPGTRASTGAPTAAMNDSGVPLCVRSPVCDPKHGGSASRPSLARVQWKQEMGYTFSYPFDVPAADKGVYNSGVPAVGIDSKDNLWAFQRNQAGRPQLFKFSPDHRLILSVDEAVLGHQEKPHGMSVDRFDNVWIADADGSTVMQISPEGKLLRTIGEKNHRGDWDESRKQRLLWQPMYVASAANGDIYIGEGHGNESPNDTESDDAANNVGAARIIHLDKNGNFINQWFGNSVGQGKFSMAHGVAVDPSNGDVWIGDREQYRLVIYSKEGQFIRTIQMRNLMCAIGFDRQGNPWVASGQDGQLLKIDRNGNVLGAVGNGAGRGPGQAIETTYMAWDRKNNLYSGDTSVARITQWAVPKRR